MKWNSLMLICLLVFSIGMVSAYQPHKQNTTLYYSFTSNNGTSCNLTYGNTPEGLLILDQEATKNGQTFNVTILNDNFTTIGDYCFNIVCSDGSEIATGNFCRSVTINGKEPAEGIIIVVFSLIFIAIFGFGLIYFLKSIAHIAQLDMDLIDASIMVATYLAMWMFYYFSFEYLGNAFINEILEIMISVGAVTHVFLPLVGFVVSFIMTNLKAKQKARITY
jgi:hypothetical protein